MVVNDGVMIKWPSFSISFFMPLYNEEENVMMATTSALQVLNKITQNFELILVDDGSTDSTATIVKLMMNQDKRIKLIQHHRNKGYGQALRTGIAAATKMYTFYTDADNQFDINILPHVIKHLQPKEMVVGYRIKRKDSWQRLIMSRVYGAIIKLFFGISVNDVNCSFKLFPTALYQRNPLSSNTVFIDAEMIIRAKQANLHIHEVPVTHSKRQKGTSKFEFGKKGIMIVIHPGKILEILVEIGRLYPSLTDFSSTTKIDKPNGKHTQSNK